MTPGAWYRRVVVVVARARGLAWAGPIFIAGCVAPTASELGELGVERGTGGGSGAAIDSDSSGANGASDTGGAPGLAWPDSSMCLGAFAEILCTQGVAARSWGEDAEYLWLGDDTNWSTSAALRDGVVLFPLGADGSGVLASGLAEAVDGDLFIAGSGAAIIGGVPLPHDNLTSRFVARVTPAGEVRWSKHFADVDGDRVLVAPHADGGVVIIADLSEDLTLDGVFVPGGSIGFPIPLAAKFTADAELAWVTSLPADGTVDFPVVSIESGAAGEIEMVGPLRGTIALGDTEVSFPFGVVDPADVRVVLSSDGVWLSVAAEP